MAWILIEQFSCGEMSQNPFLFIYFFATLFLTLLTNPLEKLQKLSRMTDEWRISVYFGKLILIFI